MTIIMARCAGYALACGLSLVAVAVPSAASPEDNLDDWLKSRQEHFAELSAKNRDQLAQIAAIKTRTAAMIAAYRAPPGSDHAAPVIWRATDQPVVILDDPVAPRMVMVPAGEFTMGTPGGKPGSSRRVRIGAPIAVSMFPIVYGEFAQFVAATHYASRTACVTFEGGSFAARPGRDWRNPGFPEAPRSPAACIGYDGATAYAAWLSARTGHRYRLLSEAEYEYVNRAGATTAYWWGNDPAAACLYANGFDQDATPYPGSPAPIACRDKYAVASSVGVFKPNAFGLFDTSGDVASWTADCWSADVSTAPVDGSPHAGGDCRRRVVRGGSWADTGLAAADRRPEPIDRVTAYQGFRLARLL